jgi:hypothetical protein
LPNVCSSLPGMTLRDWAEQQGVYYVAHDLGPAGVTACGDAGAG